MEVRRATGADADAIAGIQERGWQAAYRHVFPADELDRGGFIKVSRWTERLERPPAGWSTFVAEGDAGVVGFASVGPSRDERGVGELYAIYVEPTEWSTGAGRALIERAEEQLQSEYAEATLWVLEDNPRARRFYERAGWALDGGRKAEPRWGVRAPEVRYRKRFEPGSLREPGSAYTRPMWSWIVLGVVYVLVLGGFRWLGGIGAAAEALREWGRASSSGSRPLHPSS